MRQPLKLYYNLCDNVPEYTLNPLEPKNLLKILMILNMVNVLGDNAGSWIIEVT